MEKGLTKLFSSCQSLESLNVSENEILKGDCFEGLPKTIKKLNISWYIFFWFMLFICILISRDRIFRS